MTKDRFASGANDNADDDPEILGHDDARASIARTIARFRERHPRIHVITNAAVQPITAEVLLAAGAFPSLTIAAEEVGEFVARADALFINLGTFDPDRRAAAEIATATARAEGRPWVLDPFFADRSVPRRLLARRLLAAKPTVIRAEPADLAAISNGTAAAAFAAEFGIVVVQVGETVEVIDSRNELRFADSHPLLSQARAMHGAIGALIAGMNAVEPDPYRAALAGIAFVEAAGAWAGGLAHGPGTFIPHILDAFAGLQPDDVAEAVRFI